MTERNLHDLDFWRQLIPWLSIGGAGENPAPLPGLDEARLSAVSELLWRDGYLNCQALYPEADLAPVRRAMETLQDKKLPQAFIYLFDEVWALFRRAQPLLAHFLGEDYRVLPHFWAWYIEPGRGRGWPPHRDSADCSVIELYGQEMLVSLSLWLPLSEATPENGCMSVLPRSREKALERESGRPIEEPAQIPHQDVLCLPAKAGSLLGWRQDLYHWGGRSSSQAREPRLSLSLEFQNGALDALCEPLFDPASPPAPEDRLALIFEQFGKYGHMEAMPDL